MNPYVYDIEVFPNYFLFHITRDGKHWVYENPKQVAELLNRSSNIVLAGFNNKAYDDIILQHIWQDEADIDSIYDLSTKLIEGTQWQNLQGLKFAKRPWAFSIDMFQILEKKAGLKEWQCHTHFKTVKESPVSFTAPLPKDRVEEIKTYCRNDVIATESLLKLHWEKILLRIKLQEKFKLSNKIYSMGSARLAEEVFVSEHVRVNDTTYAQVGKACDENPDNCKNIFECTEIILPCVHYVSEEFNTFKSNFLNSKLVEDNTSWHIVCPSDISRHIKGKLARDVPVSWFSNLTLAGRQFTMGVGGLHTQDERGEFFSDETYQVIDADVTSYYPSLIVNWDLTPKHIPGMRDSYAKILADRIIAKKSGDKLTSEALKLIANSTFGKFNERFSKIRSVKSALQITLNGQLMILMLVEKLHLAGYEILSANTDGVTIKVPRGTDLTPIFSDWESQTKMKLEVAEYSKYLRRDINNYIALTSEGKIKFKGAINEDSLKDQARVVKIAAEKYLLNGVHPEETIKLDDDIKHYVYYLHTKNGAIVYHGGNEVGKTIRWFHSSRGSVITRGNSRTETKTKVPCGHCAELCLDLPDSIPESLNKQEYIDEAWKLINSIKPLKVKNAKKSVARNKKTDAVCEQTSTQEEC